MDVIELPDFFYDAARKLRPGLVVVFGRDNIAEFMFDLGLALRRQGVVGDYFMSSKNAFETVHGRLFCGCSWEPEHAWRISDSVLGKKKSCVEIGEISVLWDGVIPRRVSQAQRNGNVGRTVVVNMDSALEDKTERWEAHAEAAIRNNVVLIEHSTMEEIGGKKILESSYPEIALLLSVATGFDMAQKAVGVFSVAKTEGECCIMDLKNEKGASFKYDGRRERFMEVVDGK